MLVARAEEWPLPTEARAPTSERELACQPKLARRSGERRLAVRQGFEPWIQLLGRITV